MWRKLKNAWKDPRRPMKVLLLKSAKWFPDKLFLSLLYRLTFRKSIDWRNPRGYNEKLQWLKLYDRRPEYGKMVDKYEAKRYIAEQIGEEYVIPTLGLYSRAEEIDFDALPDRFVLKTTHDSGTVLICKNKALFDREAAVKVLNASLRRNYFYENREWPYKHLTPRIIAEQYMVDESASELKDYKFFCFNGEPKMLFVATDRFSEAEETKFDFYDMNWCHLPFTNGHPNSRKIIERPVSFEKMKELAAKLSHSIPHVRIDFYSVNGFVYFGEMTFFHWSGLMPFSPEEWDYTLGSWIRLPEQKILERK